MVPFREFKNDQRREPHPPFEQSELKMLPKPVFNAAAPMFKKS